MKPTYDLHKCFEVKSQFETCRSNGPAGDPVPGVGQHLQLGDWQRAKGRGAHCCRDLGNF